ncbi:MAG: trypsin-like serine protease [Polyangiaceae bacterium]
MASNDLLRIGFAALLASTLGACAPESPTDEEADIEEASGRDDAIVGGTAATAYPEAVLIQMYNGGSLSSYCSGSLVSPRVVLTAGHCVQGIDGWVVKAPFASNQQAQAASAKTYDWNTDSEYVDPNQHDIGLIILSKDITLASYPTIATTPVAFGSKAQNIGRIQNGNLSTTKLFIGAQVSMLDGKKYGFPFDYASSEIIESGDSGGPVVVPGTHKIIAVNSGGGGGSQVLARVDLLASWINGEIAKAKGGSTTPATPPADPCQGLDYAGTCSGNTVKWCENSKVQQINCSASNKTCGFDKTNAYYNCL